METPALTTTDEMTLAVTPAVTLAVTPAEMTTPAATTPAETTTPEEKTTTPVQDGKFIFIVMVKVTHVSKGIKVS